MISSFVEAAEKPVRAKSSNFEFVEISRDASRHITDQLVDKDGVHAVGASQGDLHDYRLGGRHYDRTCFAIVHGDVVHAAIYVKKTYEPISKDSELCGNVRDILTSKSARNTNQPTCMVFYSICNITGAKGVGQKLVVELYKHLTEHYPQAILTTLSPVRTFDEDFIAEDYEWFEAKSEQAKAREVVEYLLTGKDMGVQGFHMGNGATPADVNLNAGDVCRDKVTGEVRKPPAMMNYKYDNDPDVLEKRAEAFKSIKLTLRNQDMGEYERERKVREMMLPLIGRELLQKAGMLTPELSQKVSEFESKRVIVLTFSAGQQLGL